MVFSYIVKTVSAIEQRWGNQYEFRSWMRMHWHYSFIYGLLYVSLIFTLQEFMKKRNAFNLRVPLVIWNFSLAIFSLAGSIRSIEVLIERLPKQGFGYATCIQGTSPPTIATWLQLFVLSKILEFGDTIFVVLRKQKLILLHWYHHLSVMIYTWYVYGGYHAPGLWFFIMNYYVHTIMYTYFGLRAARFRIPKACSVAVTAIQISQMIVGLVTTSYAFYAKHIKVGGFCRCSDVFILVTLLLYGSYFVLFLHFFYVNYVWDKVGTKSVQYVNESLANGEVTINPSIRTKHD